MDVKRDEGWFTEVYAGHYEQVLRYGLRRLGDADAAAEVAQEVFLVAWRRRVDVPDHSLPWLYGVARRVLANRWRAARTAPALVPVHDPPTTPPDDGSAVDAIRRALATLPEIDREILRLVGWEELTVAEAARVLGCTRTTAAVRLHRARRRLTAALSGAPVTTAGRAGR